MAIISSKKVNIYKFYTKEIQKFFKNAKFFPLLNSKKVVLNFYRADVKSECESFNIFLSKIPKIKNLKKIIINVVKNDFFWNCDLAYSADVSILSECNL